MPVTYTSEITIDLPRERVVELFDNPDNLKHWMPGLTQFEHISGEAGQPGAKSKLHFDLKGRRMEMLETITVRDLPDRFEGTYESDGAKYIQKNRFIAEGENRTRWISENVFHLENFMMKAIGFLMPGTFKKQTLKFMANFKKFAETGKGV